MSQINLKSLFHPEKPRPLDEVTIMWLCQNGAQCYSFSNRSRDKEKGRDREQKTLFGCGSDSSYVKYHVKKNENKSSYNLNLTK